MLNLKNAHLEVTYMLNEETNEPYIVLKIEESAWVFPIAAAYRLADALTGQAEKAKVHYEKLERRKARASAR